MRLAGLAAAVLALAALGPEASRASAAGVPCWQRVFLDWGADGTIDRAYPAQCYREALRRLRPELQIYSDARDEIDRALSLATLGGPPSGGGARRLAVWPEGRRVHADAARPRMRIGPTLDARLDLLLSRAKSPTPVPLLLLGGLALLLLAAGGAGLLAGRTRARAQRYGSRSR